MSMWSYPIGAEVNGGEPLDERTVRPALPVTIGGTTYPQNWDFSTLAPIGVKSYTEDTIQDHYTGGVPVDVETNTSIHRTYPNPIFQTEPWRKSLAEKIQQKKRALRDSGFLVDGVLFDSDAGANVAYLNFYTQIIAAPTYSTPWKASEGVWVTMDAELFTKVSTGFQANTVAAFGWQAQMDAELAAAPDTYEALKAIEDAIGA